MNYYKAAYMDNIKRDHVVEVDLDGLSLLLYRDRDDGIYCIKNICTHDNSGLFGGSIEDDVITCPQHGARFNLKTGEAVSMPAVVGLEVFPVKLEGDKILVGIEE